MIEESSLKGIPLIVINRVMRNSFINILDTVLKNLKKDKGFIIVFPGMLDSHVHFNNIEKIKETKDFFTSCNIERFCIVSPASLSGINSNSQALCFKATYPSETYIMGGLDYSGITRYSKNEMRKNLKQQLIRMLAIGFDGVKILETKPNFFRQMPFKIDEPEYEKFFETVEEERVPIVWHVVDPPEFWDRKKIHPVALKRGWGYFSKGYPSYDEIRQRVHRVLSKFSNLKIIFAHFYFLSQNLDEAVEVLEKFMSVNFDITPGAEMYVNFSSMPDEARKFFIKYQDRIVFGTDISVGRQFDRKGAGEKIAFMRKFLETDDEFYMPEGDINFLSETDRIIRGIKLPVSVLEKIYEKNFHRIVGKKPAPIDMEKALQECDRIGDILARQFNVRENQNSGYMAQKYLEKIRRKR